MPQDAVTRLKLADWPRRHLRYLLGLLLLGAFLRLVNLDRQSLWLDEAVSLQFARYDTTKCLLAEVNNPPLDRLLLHGWLNIMGDASDARLRLLPALFGILGCFAFAWLAARLLPPTTALFAIALVCLSPHHIYFSQEIRPYALLSLLATLAVALHLRSLDADARWWHELALAAVLALGMYSHYQFVWTFAVLGVHRISCAWRLGPRQVARALLPVLLAGLLFVPWAVVLIQQVGLQNRGYTTDLFRKATTLPWVLLVGETIISYPQTLDMAQAVRAQLPFVAMFGLAFATLALSGVIELWRAGGPGRLVLAWMAVPIGGLALLFRWLPMFTSRYLAFLLPALCLILAFGARRPPWPRLAPLAPAVLLLIQIYGLGLYHFSTSCGREDWRTAAGWIDARAKGDSAIVIDKAYVQLPFDRYARTRARRISIAGDEPGRTAAVNQSLQSRQVFLVEAHTWDTPGLTRQALSAHLCLVDSIVLERGERIQAMQFSRCP